MSTAFTPILMLALGGCGDAPAPPPPARPPDVLLITMDTTRQDRLGAYGFGLARTPSIDRLAAEGVRFDDHATVAPITLPSHISIMTGLTPPVHGVRDNGAYALPDAVPTLAEHLGARGYDTAAFVSAVVLDARYGLDQGFDVYDDDLSNEDMPITFFIRDRPARTTTDRVLAFLESRDAAGDQDPLFLWVHYFDPHQPYEIDREAAGDLLTLPSGYDAEIASVDSAIGRLTGWLQARERLDRTLVVLTADHGESLGDHGEKTHAVFVYDATIQVPLIMRLPGTLPAGGVVAGGTSAVDVTPTVLGLLGQDPLDGVQGLDLSAPLKAGAEIPAHPQYIESLLSERGFGMAPLVGVRDGGQKYIRAPRAERYDLRADPGELENLHPADPDASTALDRTLQAFLDEGAQRGFHSEGNPLDAETTEMLQAMGYLAPDAERDAMAGMDPKDGMPLISKLEQARHAIQGRRPVTAEVLLSELVAATPRNVTAWSTLGYARLLQGKEAEARDAYGEALAIDPRQHRVLFMMGRLSLQQGELDTARDFYTRALDVTPGFVEAMSGLAQVAWLSGDRDGAEQWATRVKQADPATPRVWNELADQRFREASWAEALALYQRALTDHPGHYRSLVQAGLAARKVGDLDQALAFTGKAAQQRPDAWVPPYNLACMQVERGDLEAALASLREAARDGLDRPDMLGKDPDLVPLHTAAGWQAVVDQVAANTAGRR